MVLLDPVYTKATCVHTFEGSAAVVAVLSLPVET